MPSHDELLDLAVAAATDAAELLLGALHLTRAAVSTKTTLTDMVTEMDHASEALVRDRILGARPKDGFLGEEGGETLGTSSVRWICDPLDGTTNYLYGHPGFNVAIAAEDDGGLVVGVVIDPLQSDVFTATRGGGAKRNGAPVACSTKDADDLGTALCATGFAYDPIRRGRQAEVLSRVLPHLRDVRRMGAAAVDLCSVACGRVDAYWERGLGPWDLAAGSLIAGEAGARVAGDAELGFTLAAPPGLFGPLRDLLVDAGAPEA